jgi:hypothetical protein
MSGVSADSVGDLEALEVSLWGSIIPIRVLTCWFLGGITEVSGRRMAMVWSLSYGLTRKLSV